VRFNGKGPRVGIDGHIRGEWYEPPAEGKGLKPPRELRTHVVGERVEYLSPATTFRRWSTRRSRSPSGWRELVQGIWPETVRRRYAIAVRNGEIQTPESLHKPERLSIDLPLHLSGE
jgi:hypothetical protein